MDKFVARQPLFDGQKEVFAYELLFRSGFENFYEELTDADQATTQVIDNSFLLLGIDRITYGKMAFINFTQNLLSDGIPFIFPCDKIGIELLEHIKPTSEIESICHDLKEQGYTLALDDYVPGSELSILLPVVDILKVEYPYLNTVQRKKAVDEARQYGIGLLAEKVQTQCEFQEAKSMGFEYFQGYFFCRPEILVTRDIPGYKLVYLQVLQEATKKDADFDRLASIIKGDLSLTYKLLRLVNSAAFGRRNYISTLKQALVLLGLWEVSRWITLIALKNIGKDKPHELLVLGLLRGRFCELLAPRVNMRERADELFLMGLLSVLDALLDRPLEEIITELPIAPDIKGALLGKDKGVLSELFSLVCAYEKGLWSELSSFSRKLGIEEEDLPAIYFEIINWARLLDYI